MIVNNRFKQVIKSRRPVLVHFYAGWCEPCRQLLPVLSAIKEIFRENIRIVKVNVDDNPSIASECRVKNLPTLILFQSGNMKWMNEGVLGSSELTEVLQKFITRGGY